MDKTMMKQIVFFLITLSVWQLKAQSVTIPFNPEWIQSKNITIDGANIELLKFKGALYDDAQPGLPVFLTEIPVDKNDGRISIEEIISEPISWNYWQEKGQEKFNEIQLSASVEKEGLLEAAGCVDCHGNHMVQNPEIYTVWFKIIFDEFYHYIEDHQL
jgi:hypothetical protein